MWSKAWRRVHELLARMRCTEPGDRVPKGILVSRGLRGQAVTRLVGVEFAQTLVGDAEVMGNLMRHRPDHLGTHAGLIWASDGQDRQAVKGDGVRGHESVAQAAFAERDTVVQAKEVRLTRWRAILNEHLDVVHSVTNPVRESVQCVFDQFLESLTRDRHATSVRGGRYLAMSAGTVGRDPRSSARPLASAWKIRQFEVGR